MSKSLPSTPQNLRQNDEIDLLELIGVLWSHKWFIIITTLVGAVGSVVFSIITIVLPPENSPLPNEYSSTALLLINTENSSMLPSGMSGLANLAGINVGSGSSYGALAVELAASNTIADIVTDEFEFKERYNITESPVFNSRREFRERLNVSLDEETGILSISYLDIEPEFSMNIVNRIVEELDNRFATIGVNKNLNQKQLLEENLAKVMGEITFLEASIMSFQEEHGALSPEQLATTQIEALASLKSQLILKELEIETYSEFSRIDDPIIKRLKSERENMIRLVSQMERGEQFEGYSSTGPSLKDLPALALEFSTLKRDYLIQTEVFRILTQEFEMVKLKVQGEGPIFQVLELGEISDKKSGPSRGMICSIITVVAFCASIIFVFLFNIINSIKNDPLKMNKIKGIRESNSNV